MKTGCKGKIVSALDLEEKAGSNVAGNLCKFRKNLMERSQLHHTCDVWSGIEAMGGQITSVHVSAADDIFEGRPGHPRLVRCQPLVQLPARVRNCTHSKRCQPSVHSPAA